jgi:putative tryptophan/tyrosine transport system substrate-binding protein
MRRREFITLLGGAAVAWAHAARAQPTKPTMPVIGFLAGGSPSMDAKRVRAFLQGLSETGHVEGKNVAIEYRWAEGRNDHLPALAADLVRRQVSVIATTSTPSALAAKAASSKIPIVFEVGSDPVELGLVASLNRPGSNVTGATTLNSEVGPKRLELLHEVVPTATVIGFLINPTSRNSEALLRDSFSKNAFDLALGIIGDATDSLETGTPPAVNISGVNF